MQIMTAVNDVAPVTVRVCVCVWTRTRQNVTHSLTPSHVSCTYIVLRVETIRVSRAEGCGPPGAANVAYT